MLTTASDVAVVEFTFIFHTITTSKHTETIETSTLEITFVLVWQTPTSQAAHTTAHSTSCTSFTYNLHNTYIHIITHPKFFVNRFSVFGVMTSQNLAISNHRVGYSYNSVSTGVLHSVIYTWIYIVPKWWKKTLRCSLTMNQWHLLILTAQSC